MKSHGVFAALPAGSISPRGWLGEWAHVNAEGWLLDYARQEDPRVYGRLWNRLASAENLKTESNEWLDPPDYNAYFADGLLRYAHLFPGSELAHRADIWVERALASQDADGYIGAFMPVARWRHWLEVFSQSVVLEALLFRHEATGDGRILDAVERCARCQMAAWSAPGTNRLIFATHGTVTVRLMTALHGRTGDERYLAFATEVMDAFGKARTYREAEKKALCAASRDVIAGAHVVMESEHVGFPALLFERTGLPELLAASRAAWDMVERHHMSIDGSPVGNEIMYRVGPRENTEHCAAVEWILTGAALARITGEARYGDAVERCFYNAYPAAKGVDGCTVAYMHAPNQLTAAEWGSSTFYDNVEACPRQHYHSAHEPLCCNSNGPRGIPWYIDAMVMAARDGVAVVLYGPCAAEAALPGGGDVRLEVETRYPFEDEVVIRVTPDGSRRFPLLVRIPSWATRTDVAVNGAPTPLSAQAGEFFELRRAWNPGDSVRLRFSPDVRTETISKSEFGIRSAAVAFWRGPLAFALPVPEAWNRLVPRASAPVQAAERVVAYQVLPTAEARWNYAVTSAGGDAADDAPSLVSRRVAPGALPWQDSPIGLRVKARRVLNWGMGGEIDHPMTPGLPFLPMQLSDAWEEVMLVPYGFTHLRLTYLPRIEG